MSNPERRVVLVLGALVLLAKLPTLATPYHWDETLWVGLAHRLAAVPLWQVLPGCHPPTLFGGRPPGLYLPLAALFKTTGPSIWLSHLAVAAVAAVGVVFTFRLGALLYGRPAGILAALFLFLNPMYFAQAGMFVADLPVAAFGVATVYWALRRRYVPYLAFAVVLVLLKETALAIIFAVSVYVLVRERRRGFAGAAGAALAAAVPLLLMGLYYAAQKLTSGIFFVHYAEPFDWLQPGLALGQLRAVTRWLFAEQLRWIFTGLIAANLVSNPAARRRPELLLFGLITLCSGYAFSVLYFLPRYLLPVMPYCCVLAAGALIELFPGRAVHMTLGGGLVLLLALRLPGTERPGNREWDLGYRAAVQTYATTAAHLEHDHGGARILATWPLTAYLRRPELGYVRAPLQAFHPRAVGPLDAAPRFDVVVACSLGDTDPGPLTAYAARQGLKPVDRIAVQSFHCEVYGSGLAHPSDSSAGGCARAVRAMAAT